jgi:hypothetical protein
MIKKIKNKYVKLLIFVAFWFVCFTWIDFLLEGEFNLLKTAFISIPTSLFIYYQNNKQNTSDEK